MIPFSSNPLKTRADLIRAAQDLLGPMSGYLTEGHSRVMLSAACAHYDEAIAGMEGFSRCLWAIVPMLMGKCPEAEPFWALWKDGILHGTDPAHAEYWGEIGDSDQRMVEMAVMGMGLAFIPERFLGDIPEESRQALWSWLNQINGHDMPTCNWKFFRILVNVGFLRAGLPCNREQMEADLVEMEGHYAGNGWYFDRPGQNDYYTLWAFHYYGLVYAVAMKEIDPERSERFLERARMVMPRFACWFDGEGRALPYGRSLTYRFAQASFWAACAFAGVTSPEIGWGEMKSLFLKNLRYWFSLPVFDRDGILTVGYGYPNYAMTDGYNAPGSPYWALKVFAVLALPEEHPFWQAEEKDYLPPLRFCDAEAHQLLLRDPENRHVVSFTAGNHSEPHVHVMAKYEKFAYSTAFAFSVSAETNLLEKGAFDSMLAFRRQGRDTWHTRYGCESWSLEEDRIAFTWIPMEGVLADTVIIPVNDRWHIRRHIIRTAYDIEVAEGGFAVSRDEPGARPCDRIRSVCEADETHATAYGPFGSCVLYNLQGYGSGTVIRPEANTNLLRPRTLIPTLRQEIPAGETVLLCAVYASPDGEIPAGVPTEVLNIAQSCC